MKKEYASKLSKVSPNQQITFYGLYELHKSLYNTINWENIVQAKRCVRIRILVNVLFWDTPTLYGYYLPEYKFDHWLKY